MERSDIASVHYYCIRERAVMRLSAASHCRISSFVRKTSFAIKNDSWDTGIYFMCREYRGLLRLLRSFCSLMIISTTRDYTVMRFTQYFTFILNKKVFVPEKKEIEICFVFAKQILLLFNVPFFVLQTLTICGS